MVECGKFSMSEWIPLFIEKLQNIVLNAGKL